MWVLRLPGLRVALNFLAMLTPPEQILVSSSGPELEVRMFTKTQTIVSMFNTVVVVCPCTVGTVCVSSQRVSGVSKFIL